VTKFDTPYLKRLVRGKYVTFDVTLSAPAAKDPLNSIASIIRHFREQEVVNVLDFGAGKLRNTWPLLAQRSLNVYVCEFEELITVGSTAHAAATRRGLKELFYPGNLLGADARFDAVLLSYVLHVIPDLRVRKDVLTLCASKLVSNGWLVVASPKYNTPIRRTCTPADAYKDGWVRYAPNRFRHKSFYSEPSKADLSKFVGGCGFALDGDWLQATAHVLRFRKKI
jgi:hypothetical protein